MAWWVWILAIIGAAVVGTVVLTALVTVIFLTLLWLTLKIETIKTRRRHLKMYSDICRGCLTDRGIMGRRKKRVKS